MERDLEISGYRCFSEEAPAKFSIKPGFTALIGTNNAGKSSLLKLFYELRPVFQQLAAGSAPIRQLFLEGLQSPNLRNPQQIYTKGGRDRITIKTNLPSMSWIRKLDK